MAKKKRILKTNLPGIPKLKKKLAEITDPPMGKSKVHDSGVREQPSRDGRVIKKPLPSGDY